MRHEIRCPLSGPRQYNPGVTIPAVTATPEQASLLRELAHTLKACRDVYLAVWAEGLEDARKGSQAYADFNRAEVGPGGPWPDWVAPATRTTAVRLVRQQADICVAVGVLIGAYELFEPVYSLARSAFEFGLRAYWLLDVEADLRQRCARARLMELVSVHHLRDAARDRPDAAERQADLAEMKAGAQKQKAMIAALFDDVQLADDPTKWSIEGTRYESWTDIAERWLARAGSNTAGGGLYKLLAIRAHPQGYSATQGISIDGNGIVQRSTSIGEIHRVANMVMSTFYLSLVLISTYHGLESQVIKHWEAEVERQFPRIFNAPTPAPGRPGAAD